MRYICHGYKISVMDILIHNQRLPKLGKGRSIWGVAYICIYYAFDVPDPLFSLALPSIVPPTVFGFVQKNISTN